jgi:hypothetical protein
MYWQCLNCEKCTDSVCTVRNVLTVSALWEMYWQCLHCEKCTDSVWIVRNVLTVSALWEMYWQCLHCEKYTDSVCIVRNVLTVSALWEMYWQCLNCEKCTDCLHCEKCTDSVCIVRNILTVSALWGMYWQCLHCEECTDSVCIVRNVLTVSAILLEDEGLDNRNSVFLINPVNRQLTDALQYESDISDVLIILTGRSLFVARWDCGFESLLGAWKSVSCQCCVLSGRDQSVGLNAHITKSCVNVTTISSPIWHPHLGSNDNDWQSQC